MPRLPALRSLPSPPSLLGLFVVSLAAAALAGLPACSPAKPPETPEVEGAAPKDKGEDSGKESKETKEKDTGSEESAGVVGGVQGAAGEAPPKVDKSLSLDTYEMTPSDCDALGRHYGEVGRSDQMATLSPKLNEKQRSATAAQIDKVVGKLEDTWTNACHTSLVDKAVDHDAIKCAMAAKTVKDFDVCFNGTATPQAPGGKKKK
jgi:hypothetical protein